MSPFRCSGALVATEALVETGVKRLVSDAYAPPGKSVTSPNEDDEHRVNLHKEISEMPRIPVLVCGWFLSLVLAVPVAAQTPGPSAVSAAADQRTLRPGDSVTITVWPEAELGGEFAIEETGNVYLPVLGEVRAAGVPVGELRVWLREQYRTYLREAVITVTPRFTVGVLGEVVRPGLYTISPTDGLFDVIGMAGGFRQGANEEKIRVVREGEVVSINALRALRSGQGLDPLALQSGDQIIVERGGIGWAQMRDVLALFQSVALVITVVERLR